MNDVNVAAQTCLVTGGAGFIGCAISSLLADQFGRVTAVDLLHPQIHPKSERPAALDPRVELVAGDVCDATIWDSVLADVSPDVVIHLAAETGTGQSLTESTRHAHTNVVGTTQMLDAFTRQGRTPRRIVLASSRAVYGEGAWQSEDGNQIYPRQRTRSSIGRSGWDLDDLVPVPMSASTTTPKPVSVYGATKLAQENILQAWSNANQTEVSTLRLQNVYGPGQSLINSYTGILTLFCRMAIEGKPIPLYEDGAMRRDFVYIDDVARALVAAAIAESPLAEPADIGSGGYRTIAQAASVIASHFDAPAPTVCGKFREGDVRHAWADITRAEAALGWRPQITPEAGLIMLARWVDRELHHTSTLAG